MQDNKIIESYQWLTDKHINEVNTILGNNTKTLKDFKTPKMTPYYIDNYKTLNTDRKFQSATPPCSQIHFDGNCHWTCSFSHKSGCVYYLDSMSEKLKHL
jgi:hypothetical protein